jgi:hypothetical protein
MTIGPVELEAEAKVKVAKNNIQANTETTIQVGWSGGGSIKPSMTPQLLSWQGRGKDLLTL